MIVLIKKMEDSIMMDMKNYYVQRKKDQDLIVKSFKKWLELWYKMSKQMWIIIKSKVVYKKKWKSKSKVFSIIKQNRIIKI